MHTVCFVPKFELLLKLVWAAVLGNIFTFKLADIVVMRILVGAATTLPALRGYPASVNTFGLGSAPKYRWVSTGSGLTAMPSTVSGFTAVSGVTIMVGLS